MAWSSPICIKRSTYLPWLWYVTLGDQVICYGFRKRLNVYDVEKARWIPTERFRVGKLIETREFRFLSYDGRHEIINRLNNFIEGDVGF